MIDPLRTQRAEIAAIPTVSAIVGDRVRRGDPAPGDLKGDGRYQALVVLARLDSARDPRAPVLEVPTTARCYGRTRQEAAEIWGAISEWVNNRGPRVVDVEGQGVLVYRSFAPSDSGDAEDTGTHQPMVAGLIRYHVAATAVA